MRSTLVLLLLFPLFCFSQEKIITGKIKSETSVNGILVVNLTQQTQTLTDTSGKFAIKAQAADLLVFSALHLYKKRHLVEEEDFDKEISIEMDTMPYEIEAVEVEQVYIAPESLGLPKAGRRYTVAERRLKTATDWNPELGAGTMIGVSLSLDPILNALSGRTKMLKQELEIERFNKNVRQTYWYLSDEELLSEFNIPEEYTTGFRIFLIDDTAFLKIMKEQNRKEIVSEAFSLSEDYLKLIADEN